MSAPSRTTTTGVEDTVRLPAPGVEETVRMAPAGTGTSRMAPVGSAAEQTVRLPVAPPGASDTGSRPRPTPRLRSVPAPRLAPVDVVDELVERIRLIAEHAVDHYEIAATLESQGITDSIARERYGHTDVFALAREVQARARPTSRDVEPIPTTKVNGPWRDVAHGLLYLLPAAVFPVGVALLHRPSLMNGVLVVGGIGWVWSGISAWLAWQFLGVGRPTAAARVLRVAALAALPVAGVTCALVVPSSGQLAGLLAVGVAAMTFQVSSMLLMFYRREGLLFLAMVPGVLVAAAQAVVGPSLLPVAVATVGVSVAMGLAAGLWQTRGRGVPKEPHGFAGVWRLLPGLPIVLVHTALGAFFLLQAQSLFLLGHVAVLVAFLPLFLGMGVVEWRARRFAERSRALLVATSQAERFAYGLRRMLGRDLALCAGAIGAAGAVLLTALALAGELRPAAAVLCGAGIVLGPAYFIGFVLANAGRSLALCVGFGGSAAALFAFVRLEVWEPSPLGNSLAVLGSCVVLAALFATALAPLLREARNFR